MRESDWPCRSDRNLAAAKQVKVGGETGAAPEAEEVMAAAAGATLAEGAAVVATVAACRRKRRQTGATEVGPRESLWRGTLSHLLPSPLRGLRATGGGARGW